jgi:RimJ/RimL family protein N-acetyltransferase
MLDFFELSSKLDGARTARLTMRQASTADAGPLFDATRNPAFNRLLVWPRPDRFEQAQQRMDAICLEQSRGRMTAISACLQETGAWVALFRFLPYGPNPDITEMGLWMHPDYWRSSFGTELTEACMAAAFSLPEVHTLLGATLPENKGAIKVLINCGLVYTNSVIRHHEDGQAVDVFEHRITRPVWQARCDVVAAPAAGASANSQREHLQG